MTTFFGRQTELHHLHTAWQQVTEAHIPQVITIVAETGVGKSRLVQELYHTLTTDLRWDPPIFNYWPDAFQSPSTQLQVNPEFAQHQPNGPPMFLWLGMRWSDQHERNLQSSLTLPTLLEQFLWINLSPLVTLFLVLEKHSPNQYWQIQHAHMQNLASRHPNH